MRWALITGMYNVADLVEPFCHYHLELGVDQILVADYGSTDGTLDALSPFARSGEVVSTRIPTHRFVEYDPSNTLLEEIRGNASADWVSFLDPDEFLVGPGAVKETMAALHREGFSALKVERRNMTSMTPPRSRSDYLEKLTLKVTRADARVSDSAAPLSSPWIFSQVAPKVSLAAQRAGLFTIPGDHDVRSPDEPKVATNSVLEILHYPIRSYETFRDKVQLTAYYFADNPEFAPGIGWHWRRWIKLLEAGELRSEYEAQFPGESSVLALLAEGRLAEDRRLADWSQLRREV